MPLCPSPNGGHPLVRWGSVPFYLLTPYRKLATIYCPLPIFLHQKENPCSEIWSCKKKDRLEKYKTSIAAQRTQRKQ